MAQASRQETSEILRELTRGNREAAGRLMPRVYDELRRLAAKHFGGRPPGQTLQPTAVVHEAYLRLVDQRSADFNSRTHFIAVAGKAMRQVLVDAARRRMAQKRGGDRTRVAFDASFAVTPGLDTDVLALEEALRKLEKLDDRAARIIELRFFGGLSIEETADALDLARSTVTDDWRMARTWLARELGADDSHDAAPKAHT